MVRKH
jgi:hypothetical protein